MKIRSFYKNVAKKYRHTYDFDDFMRNVRECKVNCVRLQQKVV